MKLTDCLLIVLSFTILLMFMPKLDRNINPETETLITGVLDSGEEVNARRACFDGKLYIYRWGAVLDDFGAPMKCVYDERLLR